MVRRHHRGALFTTQSGHSCRTQIARKRLILIAQGLLIFSLDDSLVFDPFELTEDVTPEAVETAIKEHMFLKALLVRARCPVPDTTYHSTRFHSFLSAHHRHPLIRALTPLASDELPHQRTAADRARL